MRMRCISYGRDWDNSSYVIYQAADGRLCRVECDEWDGRYSGFPEGIVSVDIGFECDTRDYRRITKWFNDLEDFIKYCKIKGYRI